MSSLSLTLYCEGSTDRDFLPAIIQRAALVENDPDPKITFNEVVSRTSKERRLRISRESLYTTLAEEIRLERLGQVPAYQKFLEELSQVLILHFIPKEYQ